MTSCVPQKLCRRLFLLSLLSTFGKSNLIENRDKSKPEPLEVHCWNIHSLAMKTQTKKWFAAWIPRHLSARSQFPRSIAWESWEFRSAYYLHGIFGWDFWDKMEQYVSSGKNGRCCTICQKWPSWLGRVVPRFSRPVLIKDGEGWTIIFGRSSRWQFLWRGMTAYSCLLVCWLHSWGEIWIGVVDILRSHSLDEFKAHFRMRKAPCGILLREVLVSGHTFLLEILLEEGSLIRASS